MHILVCIKQTPVSDKIQINPKTGHLIREGVLSGINPFDEYAIEEAVRIKERLENCPSDMHQICVVSVITMGPSQAQEVLREAVARGCDKPYHIVDKTLAGSDTLATSYVLSMAIKKISSINKVDLIICGKQTNDSDTGHIGPQIAAHLDMPNTAYVKKIEHISNDSIRVQRLMEDGIDIIEMPLPAVLSVVKEINEPRLPSIKGKIRAKNAVITTWNAKDLGLDGTKIGTDGSPTQVVKCFTPQRHTNTGMRIQGSNPREKAAKLLNILIEKQLIK
jgi:electron transfer flavoprotein beta subunit